jgi:hypothetical protein
MAQCTINFSGIANDVDHAKNAGAVTDAIDNLVKDFVNFTAESGVSIGSFDWYINGDWFNKRSFTFLIGGVVRKLRIAFPDAVFTGHTFKPVYTGGTTLKPSGEEDVFSAKFHRAVLDTFKSKGEKVRYLMQEDEVDCPILFHPVSSTFLVEKAGLVGVTAPTDPQLEAYSATLGEVSEQMMDVLFPMATKRMLLAGIGPVMQLQMRNYLANDIASGKMTCFLARVLRMRKGVLQTSDYPVPGAIVSEPTMPEWGNMEQLTELFSQTKLA